MNEQPLDELLPQGNQDMLNAYHEYMAQASDIRNQITESDMKTLHLPLKKEWYHMIESGVKTEEYREIKPYLVKRLCPLVRMCAVMGIGVKHIIVAS